MIESSRITTSRPPSTSRLARSSAISATLVWSSTGSSKVERDDFAFDRAPHVGHFFRPLADQADHQVHVGVVGGDAVGDRLEQQRLAGFRRRDDQTALSATDRRDQVEQPGGEDVRRVSRLISSSGKIGVSVSNDGRRRAVSGSTPLTASTRSRLKNFSLSFGGRTWPEMRSPVRRPKRRICDCET